jgi:superfamily II DNA helicase RecQ
MGNDKPNIRYVLHGDLRKTWNVYQETGRDGRAWKAVGMHLFHGPGDL